MNDTPEQRASALIERLFVRHGGSVRADVIDAEVAAAVVVLQRRDPEVFRLFLHKGVSRMVFDHASRPMSAAHTADLMRSVGMAVPDVH